MSVCGKLGCLSGSHSAKLNAKRIDPHIKKALPDCKLVSAQTFLQEASAPGAEVMLFDASTTPMSPSSVLASLSTLLPCADLTTQVFFSALGAVTQDDVQKQKTAHDLSPEELRKRLPPEYHDFLDVFSRANADELPPHTDFDHHIRLEPGKTPPFKKGCRPMTPLSLEALRLQLEQWRSKNFIRPSTSSAASPVLVIRKPHGGVRVCVDYRGLNAITLKARCVLPLLNDTLNNLNGAGIFSALDVMHAFNRIRIAAGDEWLTSFTCRYGQYEFLVMPFGLCNAPSTFQAYINDALRDFIDDFCSAYMDDVIVYSKNLQDHISHVKRILQRFRERHLYLDIDKCVFHREEIPYLGILVSSRGVRIDPAKIESVTSWAPPTSVHDVQVFCGFLNFFRRFIPGFSRIAAPLYRLTTGESYTKPSGKKGIRYAPFAWTPECQEAFDTLKRLVTSAPTLLHFRPDRETWVETDASDFVSAGVLSQRDDSGELHPVAFYSKRFQGAEHNYPIYDRELLAIIRAFETWEPELLGCQQRIQVYSDHQALRHFMTTKQLTPRQARWSEFLSQFNFLISYKAGSSMTKVDSLTRRPQDLSDEGKRQRLTTLLSAENVDPDISRSLSALWLSSVTPQDTPLSLSALSSDVNDDVVDLSSLLYSSATDCDHLTASSILPRISAAAAHDPIFQIMTRAVEDDARLLPPQVLREGYRFSASDLSIIDGFLCFRKKILVPPSDDLRFSILEAHHLPSEFGHPGDRALFDHIIRHFYWPSLRRDCTKYVRNCHDCSRAKGATTKPAGFLNPLPIAQQPWLDLSMDLIESLPPCSRRGVEYRHILVVVCRLTKDKILEPLPSKSEEDVLEAFHRRVTSAHGCPITIVTDRGSAFMSTHFQHYCLAHGISIKHSSAHHPQTNGQSEITNRAVKNFLRLCVNHTQDDWVDHLPDAEFVWRNTVNRSTGMSPFFALHGFNARTPMTPPAASTQQLLPSITAIVQRRLALNTLIQRNLKWAQDEQSAYANAKRQPHPKFRVGDLVFVKADPALSERPSNSLSNKRDGPWPVIRVIDDKAYHLALPPHALTKGYTPVFSPDKLSLAVEAPFQQQQERPPSPLIVPDDDHTTSHHEEWQVDNIIDCRIHNGTHEYKATYKGDWSAWNSNPPWQPWSDFENAADAVLSFHSRHPRKPAPPEFFTQPSA